MIQGKRRYLQNEIEIAVRFSEVDAMNVVWHGNYLKYFEDGREALGADHELNYLDIGIFGFTTPSVSSWQPGGRLVRPRFLRGDGLETQRNHDIRADHWLAAL